MKKQLAFLVCICLLISSCIGCAKKESNKETMLVLAAASLTDVLLELKEVYEQEQSQYGIEYSFDSSGTCKMQIEQGVNADIFLSASSLPVTELVTKGLLLKSSVIDLLSNDIVLIAKTDCNDRIDSFEEIAKTDQVSMVATCMPEVPIGQYTSQIYDSLNLKNEFDKKAIYASNVRQVLEWVSSGNVPYGIVYSTDATINNDVTVCAVADSSLYEQVLYQAAILATSSKQEAAKDFLAFLQSDTAKEIFISYGFEVV